MAQFAISSIQNQINSDKQKVTSLEQQKIQKEDQFTARKRELEAAGDRALATMETPGSILSTFSVCFCVKYFLLPNVTREKSFKWRAKMLMKLTLGPTILNLIRQSVELQARFTQEKSNLENEIRNLKRNIDLREHQLEHLRNVAL